MIELGDTVYKDKLGQQPFIVTEIDDEEHTVTAVAAESTFCTRSLGAWYDSEGYLRWKRD